MLPETGFVIDAYTKGVPSRHTIIHHEVSYDTLQRLFHENPEEDVRPYNEYHALIVRLARENKRTRPLCAGCPFEGL